MYAKQQKQIYPIQSEEFKMIRKFTSQIDGAVFEYRFNGINLELKLDGCDWSDFIPEDKRAYSKEEYRELMSLLKVIRNEPKFW